MMPTKKNFNAPRSATVPLEVKFVDRDYGYPQSMPNQPVVEWVQMPSGDYVVRIPGGEALWFDPSGHHPKSDLIFAERPSGNSSLGRAIANLREIVGDLARWGTRHPWEFVGIDGEARCYFCGVPANDVGNGREHEANCLFRRAQETMAEQTVVNPSDETPSER